MIAFLPQGAGGQGGSASTQLKSLMEQVFTTINLFIDWLVDLVIIQKSLNLHHDYLGLNPTKLWLINQASKHKGIITKKPSCLS